MCKGELFYKPPGTWSDDSSLALCLAQSLVNGFDYHVMPERFCDWITKWYWTP
ncbi:ADP-ribosylglycohydrolase family protein [Peptoclostridium litorale]|uniref:ADP-ribosylglycohydrolase family protein n=1 Tax=Peptoclostridium litorale TaxID=1557 RepID=UPI00116117A1|nr:ADP-ribosylglycohydrolase family protein [Peptoclostridium litorale]